MTKEQLIYNLYSGLIDEKVRVSKVAIRGYAPVICIPSSLGTGDSEDIARPKCRDLTFDESVDVPGF